MKSTPKDRFRIVERIGSGSMGEVFRAEDTHDGSLVALKKLLPTSRKVFAELMRQEFRVLSGIDHPNIARAFDFFIDEESGAPYFTCEYIEGVNVLEFCKNLPSDKILDIFVQVCRGLSYVHSRGILHLDIKPENVLVSKDTGVAKIVDFGLAEQVRSRGKDIRGTLDYMAPEMRAGGEVDRRADVYSLGVLLYQIVTGKLPKENSPTVILERGEKGEMVPKRRDSDNSLAEPFRTLFQRTTNPDPSKRSQSAHSLIQIVNEMTGLAFETETPGTRESHFRGFGPIEREGELIALERALKAAANREENKPVFVLVSGPKGSGKSFVLNSFKNSAQLAGVEYINLGVKETGRRETSVFSKRFAAKESDDGSSDLVEDERVTREANDYLKSLLAYAQNKVLVVEAPPMQGASEATRKLVEVLRHGLKSSASAKTASILLIAPTRTDDEHEEFARKLKESLEPPAEFCIELQSFDSARVGRFLSEALLGEVAEDTVAMVHKVTGGNPLFIVLLLKSMADSGGLRFEEDRWVIDEKALERTKLPGSIEEVLAEGLSGLSKVQRKVLGLLSVFGRPAPLGFISDALEESAEVTIAEVKKLQEDAWLRYDYVGDNLLVRLVSATIGEILLSIEDVESKRGYHLAAANHFRNAILESDSKVRGLSTSAALHALEAADKELFLGFAEAAADEIEDGENDESLRRILGALIEFAGSSHPRANEFRERFAYLQTKAGKLAEAEELYDALQSSAIDPKDRARIARHLGEIAEQRGRIEDALEFYASGLASAPEGSREMIELSCHISFLLAWHKKNEQGLRLAKSIAASAQSSEPYVKTLTINNRALAYMALGNNQKALDDFEYALELCANLGSKRRSGTIRGNIGIVKKRLGDFVGAEEAFTESLKIRESLGDVGLIRASLLGLGSIYYFRGKIGKAVDAFTRSLKLARQMSSRFGEAAAHFYLGRVWTLQKNFDAAKANFDRSIELMSEGEKAEDLRRTLVFAADSRFFAQDFGEAQSLLSRCEITEEDSANYLYLALAFLLGLRERADSLRAINSSGELSISEVIRNGPLDQFIDDFDLSLDCAIPYKLGVGLLQLGANIEVARDFLKQALAGYETITRKGFRTHEFEHIATLLAERGELS
ncbi:MAG: protein kinase [Planctomycetes bacterium]|nr:protein kinase [Planctomycetota bacterium]